ncbi:MAG TPA: FtsX-like permease family protein [Sedimentisphaerales bacterium]|nr:FtsX-like permease family protein [Sedimentisphaerales bacterium]
MSDIWKCAWRELIRRKGRTLANILGYLLAVAIMVVLVTILIFSKNAASGVLSGTGTHFIAFVPASMPQNSVKLLDEQNEGFIAMGVAAGLIHETFVGKVKQLPTVRDAAPYLLFRLKDPETQRTFTIGGFDPRNNLAVGTTCCAAGDVLSGRFLWPGDKGVVMLEEAYALSAKLSIDSKITIAGSTFSIIGILNPGIRPGKADVYMHIDDARQVIKKRVIGSPIDDKINVVLVEVASSKVQDDAIMDVKELLPDLVVSSYACYKPASKVMGMNEGGVWLLTMIIGICAVLFALKSQLTSVIERRRDIGILKAIGWTDRDVVSQILAESVLQAIIGGILGCLVAVAILLFVPIEMLSGIEAGVHIIISSWVLVLGFALAFLGGIIAGSFPAFIAARQRPADALRSI